MKNPTDTADFFSMCSS